MGKKSRSITALLFLVILIIVTAATIKKVYDEHQEKLLRVVSQKIAEAGEVCYRKGECGEEFTLAILIEKKYIDLPVHPISKEYVDGNLKIVCKDYDCTTNVE